jgi:WD40 repeat protein
MNGDELSLEDKLASLLAEYDEKLAAAEKPSSTSASSGPGTPLEGAADLQRDQAYLQLLRRVLRPNEPTSAAKNASSQDPLASTIDETMAPAPAAAVPWTTLGRFEIIRELGQGGCGVVLLAWDPTLGREVAVKVPRAEMLVAPEFQSRFHKEARAAASLEHPNIVPVHEVGNVGPVSFIVYGYCPGVTLAAWLKERTEPVPFDLAAELCATLADAVEHAHRRGVVHRDLKPANVLLQISDCRSQIADFISRSEMSTFGQGKSAIARITDFGLAKFLVDTGEGTQSGAILGTARYMAPEQAAGKTREVGPAADIYALGAILYELLTGRPPFLGETNLDTLLQVQTEEPVPPTRLRPKLPRDLETICLKCLEKEPARRFRSAAELAADLGRFRARQPIHARPAGRLERTWKWARRRPAMAALLAVSTLAALTVLALGWGYWDNVERRLKVVQDLDIAQRDLTDKREQVGKAQKELDGLKHDVTGLQTKNQGLQADLGSRAKELQETDRTLNFTRRDLFALTLTRVGDVCDLDPLAGLQMLEDQRRCPVDLRDFTWGYYHRMCNRNYQTLPGSPGDVAALAYAPDGKILAGAGGRAPRSQIKLWDMPAGKLLATLMGHSGVIRSITFSPDGKLLASHSLVPGEVKLWDVATATEQATIPWAKGQLDTVTFSRDGGTLILVGEVRFNVGEVILWDVAAGKVRTRRELPLFIDSRSIAVAPDARTVLTARRPDPIKPDKNPGGVTIWNFDDDEPKGHLAHDGAERVLFSPDGTTLATVVRSQIKLWDSNTWALKKELNGPGMVWSPDCKALLVFGEQEMRVIDAVTYQERCTLKNQGYGVVFSPDSTLLALNTGREGLQFWDVKTGKLLEALRELWGGNPAFAPDGQTVAMATFDPAVNSARDIKLWRIGRQGPRVVQGPQRAGMPTPQGQVIDFADFPRSLHVWDAFTGRKLGTLEPPFPDHERALSPDGAVYLEWKREAGQLKIREVATGQVRTTVDFHEPLGYASAVFAPDGQVLLAVTKSGQPCLVDLKAGKELSRVQSTGRVSSLAAFSPDGKVLAWPNRPPYTVGGKPWTPPKPKLPPKFQDPKMPPEKPPTLDPIYGEVLLIDVATGKELANLKDHKGEVLNVQFSPDGKMLAARRKEGEVFLWDIAAGKVRFVLSAGVGSIAFSPDSTLLAGSIAIPSQQAIKLWDTATGQERLVLQGYTGSITSLVFSPNGKTLVSLASEEKFLRLWDAQTGQQRAVLSGPVSTPAFSADGQTLATTFEGRLYLWEAEAPGH